MRTLFLPERVLAHEVLGALPEAPTGKRPVRILDLLQGVWVERLGIGGRHENLLDRYIHRKWLGIGRVIEE